MRLLMCYNMEVSVFLETDQLLPFCRGLEITN